MYGLGRPENAIARVASSFKECLSDTEVLRTIDQFFDDLGFEFDANVEEQSLAQNVGQRRSRAAGYLGRLTSQTRGTETGSCRQWRPSWRNGRTVAAHPRTD